MNSKRESLWAVMLCASVAAAFAIFVFTAYVTRHQRNFRHTFARAVEESDSVDPYRACIPAVEAAEKCVSETDVRAMEAHCLAAMQLHRSQQLMAMIVLGQRGRVLPETLVEIKRLAAIETPGTVPHDDYTWLLAKFEP